MATLDAPDVATDRQIDTALRKVDDLADRWAKYGDDRGKRMHPLEAIQLMHDGAILGGGHIPMPDDIAAFDACFSAAPDRDRAVITVWYEQAGSAKQKAKRLGISRSQIYVELKVTLSHFRGWVRAKGIDI